MDQKRELYVNKCRDEVKNFLQKHPHLIRYTRGKNNQRAGVILMAVVKNSQDESMLFYGWSKCHTIVRNGIVVGHETFNKWLGLKKAIERLGDPKAILPWSMQDEFNNLFDRARKYFKQLSFDSEGK